jgi:hypothetical protein
MLTNGKKLLKAGMIVFLLITVVGVFSPVPITESGYTENAQVMENPETTESSGNVNLEMMMFVPTASDDGGAYYKCRRGSSVVAYFGMSEVHYLVGNVFFTLEFPGSNQVIPEGEKPTGSVTNYFYGSDSSQWKTGLLDSAELRYSEIYPGIDLVYKIYNGFIKYDFVVSPGADPGLIRLKYSNADSLNVEDDSVLIARNGNLLGDTGLHVFQSIDNSEHVVSSAFKSESSNEVKFDLGEYDATITLVIDPVNVPFSTYIGGSADDNGKDIAVENGYVYVAGDTISTNFPAINGYNSTSNGGRDCFVLKLTSDGQTLIYSTYLGGSSTDICEEVAVENGFVYITGQTSSSDFPMVNAYLGTKSTGTDGFVTKLLPDGQSIHFSTYGPVSSSGDDQNNGIAVEDGATYLIGSTDNYAKIHVWKLTDNGSTLSYSPTIDGNGQDFGMDIAVEDGIAYITGMTSSSNFPANAFDITYNGVRDGFVSIIDAFGGLDYSAYIGGAGDDYGLGIDVEDGYPYVIVTYNSADYFRVYKFDPDLGNAVLTTFQGGGQDYGSAIAVENGTAYITGTTQSTNFPMVDSAYPVFGGSTDSFVVSLTVGGVIIYSSFIGGSGNDDGNGIAVENGYVYVAGRTSSIDFPVVNAYNETFGGSVDCFVSNFYLDNDCDGLSDIHELNIGTDPLRVDTDNDNFLDAYEVSYGSDPTDHMSYPAMPQAWYDAIYVDLDGNATLIQQVLTWLDGNHTAIETLFMYVEGNASLLIDTVNFLDGNATQLAAVAALVTGNAAQISLLNASVIGDFDEIRDVIDILGASVGDLDYDGLDDLDEISHGTDVDCIDTDVDNLNDAFEIKIGTDPLDDDSDGDSYLDGLEVIAGTNPLDALDYPGATTPPPDNSLLLGVIVVGAAGAVVVVVMLVFLMKRE